MSGIVKEPIRPGVRSRSPWRRSRAGRKASTSSWPGTSTGSTLWGREEAAGGALLVAPRVELEPPRVPLGDRVRVVREDGPRRGHGPVHDPHDDGRAGPGRPVEELVHEEEALARRRRGRPRAEGPRP